MKSVIILALALLSVDGFAGNVGSELLATPTQTRITKTNGGLRGYKNLKEDIKPGVYANLACSDPGTLKCLFKNPPHFEVTDLTPGDMENIDLKINECLLNGIFDSKFTYTSSTSNKYLVIFEGKAEQGIVDYTIYTKNEASAIGYEI